MTDVTPDPVPTVDVIETRVSLGARTVTIRLGDGVWSMLDGATLVAQFAESLYDAAVDAAGTYLQAMTAADALAAQASVAMHLALAQFREGGTVDGAVKVVTSLEVSA